MIKLPSIILSENLSCGLRESALFALIRLHKVFQCPSSVLCPAELTALPKTPYHAIRNYCFGVPALCQF